MKRLFTLIFLCCLSWSVGAQLDSAGASYVDFSVDADTRTGFQKISALHPDSTFHHDDWFKLPGYNGRGRGVIDTTGAAALTAQLKAKPNTSFVKRMSLPPYSILPVTYANGAPIGHRFWVDGVYFRDNAIGDDSTSFTGSKNGDNPNNWIGTISPVSDKTDIIDVYTHVRTSGTRPQADSAWFFAGVATVGTNGSRYFDIEVYRENISYSPVTKRFTSAGTSEGHSEWRFDNSGNVIQTGDIIISVTYSAGKAPEIDFRIWVSNNTYSTSKPSAFKFGSKFNSIGTAGYAQILSNSGSSNWGSGVSNYISNNSTSDSTYSTPWGTINATTKAWGQHYDKLQFVEVALNFSRFGMNPFAYVTSFCKSPYATILIKSRNSAEFNSSLSDFVGPQSFTVKNLSPFAATTDTLSCAKTSGTIQLQSDARNYYRWFNLAGDTLQRDSDVPTFSVNKAGTYIVEATNFQACAPMKRDTIVVSGDYYKPVAHIDAFPPNPYHQLMGGNVAASNYPTPFGSSQGLLWNWSGPNGFTSTIQNPKVDTLFGKTYELVVTEKRNGCKDTAIFDLAILFNAAMQLEGRLIAGTTNLWWNRPDAAGNWSYEVQKSTNGVHFTTIKNIAATGMARLTFKEDAGQTPGFYRVVAHAPGSAPLLSSVVKLHGSLHALKVWRTESRNTLMVQTAANGTPTEVRVFDLSGRLLQKTMVAAGATTAMQLPAAYYFQPVIVALFQDGQLVYSKQL
ncbi:hypothetical protein [Paracnuella aquatica]|uniref:hypothetical protein n=1 Tax=Paracnuella aquatica TaxID=2268757 RepID=UPI000DEF3AF6|nr:hypothetical protein [Paracnuella aquatica]RPD43637.1 hypothetical protein DRJ53_19475 [Paracnuella aquatica]